MHAQSASETLDRYAEGHNVASCTAEFLVEPFTEGAQGAHVVAAIEAVAAAGLVPVVGPFATTVEGEPALVLDALSGMIQAAMAAGASKIAITTTVTE